MNNFSKKIKESIERANKKISETRKTDSLVFPVFTDLHTLDYDHEYVKRLTFVLKHITEKTECDMVVNLGDNFSMLGRDEHITNTELKNRFERVLTAIYEATNLPQINLNGNHDGIGTDFFKPDFWNSIVKGSYGNTFAVYGDEGSYYYIDFEKSNTRCICISIPYDSELECNMPTPLWKFGEKQLDWLKNVALNTAKDVIILSHVPFNYQYKGDKETTIDVWDGKKKRTSYISALCGEIEDVNKAIEILNNFENKGRLVAVFSGHTHEDALWLYGEGDGIETTENLLHCPQVITTSTCLGSGIERTLCISVDVVVWTPSCNRLNIIRIGDGEDREIVLE